MSWPTPAPHGTDQQHQAPGSLPPREELERTRDTVADALDLRSTEQFVVANQIAQAHDRLRGVALLIQRGERKLFVPVRVG